MTWRPGLAEGYQYLPVTLPLDLASGLGFATVIQYYRSFLNITFINRTKWVY